MNPWPSAFATRRAILRALRVRSMLPSAAPAVRSRRSSSAWTSPSFARAWSFWSSDVRSASGVMFFARATASSASLLSCSAATTAATMSLAPLIWG
jgi:hypothetical protein